MPYLFAFNAIGVAVHLHGVRLDAENLGSLGRRVVRFGELD